MPKIFGKITEASARMNFSVKIPTGKQVPRLADAAHFGKGKMPYRSFVSEMREPLESTEIKHFHLRSHPDARRRERNGGHASRSPSREGWLLQTGLPVLRRFQSTILKAGKGTGPLGFPPGQSESVTTASSCNHLSPCWGRGNHGHPASLRESAAFSPALYTN